MLFQRLRARAVGEAVAILGFLPILAANEGPGDNWPRQWREIVATKVCALSCAGFAAKTVHNR